MKTHLKFLTAAALLASGSVFAQSAGTWMVHLGAVHLAPDVTSDCLSAPDFGDYGNASALGCSRADVSANT